MCFDIWAFVLGTNNLLPLFWLTFYVIFALHFYVFCVYSFGNINLAANIDRQLMFYVINMERVQYWAH